MTRRPPPPAVEGCLAEFVRHTHLAGHEFLDRYRELRLRDHLRGAPHEPRAIVAAAELLRWRPRIAQTEVHQLLGGTWRQVREAERAIADYLGVPIRLQNVPDLRTDDALGRLLRWARAEFGDLPRTCLDPDLGPNIAAPNPRYAARALVLQTPTLRYHACLSLFLTAADHFPGARITRELKACEMLDQWLSDGGSDINLAVPLQARQAMLGWLGSDPCLLRLDAWRILAQASGRTARYLEDEPGVAKRAAGRIAHIPQPGHYDLAKRVAAAARAGARRARAATADPIADDLDGVLHLADLRFEEVATVRDTFDTVCAELERSGRQQGGFRVTLARTGLTGEPLEGARTLEFVAYRRDLLAARFSPLGYRAPDREPERWLLAYCGVADQRDEQDVVPLFEAYRLGAFTNAAGRSDWHEQALAAFADRVGRLPIASGQMLFQFAAGLDRRLAECAFRKGIVLVPITIVHFGFAVARSTVRSSIVSATRMGEARQQRHEEDSFRWAGEDPDLFAFAAIPKGRTEPDDFYIDEATLLAISTVIEVAERNGSPLEAIPPPVRRCGNQPGQYVYQLWGRAIESNDINGMIQALLFGYRVSSHDGRAGLARFAKHAGLGERRVQATLHHLDPAATAIYTPSTERMKTELARRLLGRLHPPRRGDELPRAP